MVSYDIAFLLGMFLSYAEPTRRTEHQVHDFYPRQQPSALRNHGAHPRQRPSLRNEQRRLLNYFDNMMEPGLLFRNETRKESSHNINAKNIRKKQNIHRLYKDLWQKTGAGIINRPTSPFNSCHVLMESIGSVDDPKNISNLLTSLSKKNAKLPKRISHKESRRSRSRKQRFVSYFQSILGRSSSVNTEEILGRDLEELSEGRKLDILQRDHNEDRKTVAKVSKVTFNNYRDADKLQNTKLCGYNILCLCLRTNKSRKPGNESSFNSDSNTADSMAHENQVSGNVRSSSEAALWENSEIAVENKNAEAMDMLKHLLRKIQEKIKEKNYYGNKDIIMAMKNIILKITSMRDNITTSVDLPNQSRKYVGILDNVIHHFNIISSRLAGLPFQTTPWSDTLLNLPKTNFVLSRLDQVPRTDKATFTLYECLCKLLEQNRAFISCLDLPTSPKTSARLSLAGQSERNNEENWGSFLNDFPNQDAAVSKHQQSSSSPRQVAPPAGILFKSRGSLAAINPWAEADDDSPRSRDAAVPGTNADYRARVVNTPTENFNSFGTLREQLTARQVYRPGLSLLNTAGRSSRARKTLRPAPNPFLRSISEKREMSIVEDLEQMYSLVSSTSRLIHNAMSKMKRKIWTEEAAPNGPNVMQVLGRENNARALYSVGNKRRQYYYYPSERGTGFSFDGRKIVGPKNPSQQLHQKYASYLFASNNPRENAKPFHQGQGQMQAMNGENGAGIDMQLCIIYSCRNRKEQTTDKQVGADERALRIRSQGSYGSPFYYKSE